MALVVKECMCCGVSNTEAELRMVERYTGFFVECEECINEYKGDQNTPNQPMDR